MAVLPDKSQAGSVSKSSLSHPARGAIRVTSNPTSLGSDQPIRASASVGRARGAARPVDPDAWLGDADSRPIGRAQVPSTPIASIDPVDSADEPRPRKSRSHSKVRSHRRVAGKRALRGGEAVNVEEPLTRKAVRTGGEIFITLGLVVLLFAFYQIYGKAFQIKADQERLDNELEQAWSHDSGVSTKDPKEIDKPLPGLALARIHIPDLNQQWVVVEGTSLDDIKLAPGHYTDSQMPGQVGNFAVAGHRTPAIFWNLDKVPQGTTVIVETRDYWYIYQVTKNHIIHPTEVSVVAANPDNPEGTASRKLMTLTTCHPKWSNSQRLIVQAEMVREQPKSEGRPSELKE